MIKTIRANQNPSCFK